MSSVALELEEASECIETLSNVFPRCIFHFHAATTRPASPVTSKIAAKATGKVLLFFAPCDSLTSPPTEAKIWSISRITTSQQQAQIWRLVSKKCAGSHKWDVINYHMYIQTVLYFCQIKNYEKFTKKRWSGNGSSKCRELTNIDVGKSYLSKKTKIWKLDNLVKLQCCNKEMMKRLDWEW